MCIVALVMSKPTSIGGVSRVMGHPLDDAVEAYKLIPLIRYWIILWDAVGEAN